MFSMIRRSVAIGAAIVSLCLTVPTANAQGHGHRRGQHVTHSYQHTGKHHHGGFVKGSHRASHKHVVRHHGHRAAGFQNNGAYR
jgi:hypothetical protein